MEPAICVLHHTANESLFLQAIEHYQCSDPMKSTQFCTNEPHGIIITGTFQSLFGKLGDQQATQNLDWGLCHYCSAAKEVRVEKHHAAEVDKAVTEEEAALPGGRFGVERETPESPTANFSAVRKRLQNLKLGLEKTMSRLESARQKEAEASNPATPATPRRKSFKAKGKVTTVTRVVTTTKRIIVPEDTNSDAENSALGHSTQSISMPHGLKLISESKGEKQLPESTDPLTGQKIDRMVSFRKRVFAASNLDLTSDGAEGDDVDTPTQANLSKSK